MNKINWEEIAKNNNLTFGEFKKEIYFAAACIGSMEIDKNEIGGHMKFTCSDNIGPIELWIRRGD